MQAVSMEKREKQEEYRAEGASVEKITKNKKLK